MTRRDSTTAEPEPIEIEDDVIDLDLLHDEGEMWIPHRLGGEAHPHTITGHVLDIRWIDSDYGDQKLHILLRERNGGKVWALRTYASVLHAAWMREQPKPGTGKPGDEIVSVKYIGMIKNKSKGKKDYANFSVKVINRERARAFDYGQSDGPPVEPDVPIDDSDLPFDVDDASHVPGES